MFSFLKTGNIPDTIKMITNIPGLFTADGDKIKYAILNHSTAMRKNLADGAPIFTNIGTREADLERANIAHNNHNNHNNPSFAANAAAAATSASPFTETDLRIDNAALTLIIAKELAFLNRTTQMISLIAARYREEQEEQEEQGDHLSWGHGEGDEGDEGDGGAEHYEDDTVRRGGGGGGGEEGGRPEVGMDRLSTKFLTSSGQLRQRFSALCGLAGTNTILVNGMTTMDRPDNDENREKQRLAQKRVISEIFHHFCKFDAEHRGPVVAAFMELRDISVIAWKILSMFAFSDLFRFAERSEFTRYQPNDAIFTQGHDYRLGNINFRETAVAVMQFPSNVAMTAMVEDAMAVQMTQQTRQTQQTQQTQQTEDDCPSYD